MPDEPIPPGAGPAACDPAATDLYGAAILQVLPALETGGVERGTLDMVRAIAGANGRPLVASAGGRLAGLVAHAGGTHVALPLQSKNPWRIRANARALARLIREHGVALVHARSRAPGWSALWAARRTGVGFVTTYHGAYGEDAPFKRRYNRVMASGDRVIVGSRFMARHVLARHPLDPARLRVIPRGLDPAAFDPGAVSGVRIARLAQRWRLPLDGRVVMLPGRLTRWKGGLTLIRALALARTADAWAVLVGDDQGRSGYAAALLAEAARLGVADRLVLAGHCEDMPAALMLAELVVTPSIEPEAFGRALVEAQAMARPVIACAHGAATEIVAQGTTGWLIPPDDPEALAEAIDGILDWPAESRALLGNQARDAALARFGTGAMQAATLAVYREVLFGAPPAAENAWNEPDESNGQGEPA